MSDESGLETYVKHQCGQSKMPSYRILCLQCRTLVESYQVGMHDALCASFDIEASLTCLGLVENAGIRQSNW